MNCNFDDCANDAAHQVGFRAYALNHPRVPNNKVEGFIGLAVCDDCKPRVDLAEIFSPDWKARINNAMTAQKKAPLDLEKPELIFHEIIDNKLVTS